MKFNKTTAFRAAGFLCALVASVGLGANVAQAQFLKKSTHDAPVFYDIDVMRSYFEGQPWLESNPDSLEPMERIDIPFEWAQGWIRDRRTFSRAMVMGQPESCPLMSGVYGAPDAETAVRLAFTTCFFRLELLEDHQQESCGCQLAMVDQVVYAEPGGFTNFGASPAIVEFEDGRQDTLGIVYFSELIGQDQPIRMVDNRGRTRCEGTYSINALLFNSLELECDFFCEPYDGRIKFDDWNFGRGGFKPTATVSGKTCDGVGVDLNVGLMNGEPAQ